MGTFIFPNKHRINIGVSLLETIFIGLTYKVGPLLVINGVITPVSGVITPVTHLFSAIYRAKKTPLITGDGAHLVGFFPPLDSP